MCLRAASHGRQSLARATACQVSRGRACILAAARGPAACCPAAHLRHFCYAPPWLLTNRCLPCLASLRAWSAVEMYPAEMAVSARYRGQGQVAQTVSAPGQAGPLLGALLAQQRLARCSAALVRCWPCPSPQAPPRTSSWLPSLFALLILKLHSCCPPHHCCRASPTPSGWRGSSWCLVATHLLFAERSWGSHLTSAPTRGERVSMGELLSRAVSRRVHCWGWGRAMSCAGGCDAARQGPPAGAVLLRRPLSLTCTATWL